MLCRNCDSTASTLYALPAKLASQHHPDATLCYFCFLHLAHRTPRKADLAAPSVSQQLAVLGSALERKEE